jgi:hypothetical protein
MFPRANISPPLLVLFTDAHSQQPNNIPFHISKYKRTRKQLGLLFFSPELPEDTPVCCV